jgi:hypothetical protein
MIKTPEELALENESLRASLDALAVHTEAVNKENQELRKSSQEREVVLRNAVAGVRKEVRPQVISLTARLRGHDWIPVYCFGRKCLMRVSLARSAPTGVHTLFRQTIQETRRHRPS